MSFALTVTLPNVIWTVGSYNSGSGFYSADTTQNTVKVDNWVWNPTLLTTPANGGKGAVTSNGASVTDGTTNIIGTVTDLSMNFYNSATSGNIASSITINFYGMVSVNGSAASPLKFSITALPSITGSNIYVGGSFGTIQTTTGTYENTKWQVEMFNTGFGQSTSLATTYGDFTFSFALLAS